MKGAALRAALFAFVLVLAGCDTTTDVVLGTGEQPGGFGGVPHVEGFDENRGHPGSGGTSVVASSMGSGGIMEFPMASGGGPGRCSGIVQIEELIASDVYVLFDQSSSMNEPLPAPGSGTWWQAGQEAFARFVGDPGLNGYGVGLQFFPLGGGAPTSCTADYSAPEVPVAPLPANAPALLAAMRGRVPDAFTPLGPALAGAISHMSHSASGWPQVLLITDGFPSECEPRDLAGVAGIARAGLQSGVGVRTHVVGLNLGAAGESLHAIAEAGGTVRATLIDAGGDVAEELYQAMRGALRRPNLCRWKIPVPPPGQVVPRPEQMSVVYRLADSPEQRLIPHVDSSAQCQGDGAPGWYLETNAAGTDVVLCPRSCVETRNADDVTIVFGCGSTPYQ